MSAPRRDDRPFEAVEVSRPEPEARPLYEMDPTGRFSDRAADYVRYRPDYPTAAIEAILGGLPDPSRLVTADVGAGTGISARQLADRGPRVMAVEPNAAMRAAAAPHPRVSWHDGSAEATALPRESVDLVLCAQAFHWFRQREAMEELHRILRPGGRLALMWNSRDRRDPLTRAYIEAIRAVNGEDPIEGREFDPGVIHRDGWFAPATLATFEHQQLLTREGLIGRATSASYVPREGRRFEILSESLAALFERYRDPGGHVIMKYVTQVFLAGRR